MRKILLPPILLGLCLLGMVAVNYFQFASMTLISGPMSYIGYGVMVIGLSLPIWSARLFRRHDTNILPYKNPDHIVTTGPFSFSRNPMYLGMFLLLLGGAIRYGTATSFVFPMIYFCVANWWYIPFEESRMAEAFGVNFAKYKDKTRRWL